MEGGVEERLIARGQPNKLIAASLGISEKTVHIHRQHIMEKAAISSAAAARSKDGFAAQAAQYLQESAPRS